MLGGQADTGRFLGSLATLPHLVSFKLARALVITNKVVRLSSDLKHVCEWNSCMKAGRQGVRQTDREAGRQAGRQADRYTSTHTQAQAHTEAHTHTSTSTQPHMHKAHSIPLLKSITDFEAYLELNPNLS